MSGGKTGGECLLVQAGGMRGRSGEGVARGGGDRLSTVHGLLTSFFFFKYGNPKEQWGRPFQGALFDYVSVSLPRQPGEISLSNQYYANRTPESLSALYIYPGVKRTD